jgi:RimJ/RimL family protein N-acetyltransferase
LRPFCEADLARLIAWRNDPAVRDGALWPVEPFGPEEASRWLDAVTGSGDGRRLVLAIELAESARLVGLTHLSRIDRASGTGYFGIVVGERDVWGHGVARQALAAMLERAAGLGLRKVLLEVAADNTRALEIYRRSGFETEGVLKRQVRRGDRYEDVLLMARFLEP